ncbi:MAG TPA: zinc ribbon domain-containing protein [Candidatus Angelobacter sp.]|nr:zinc ribbon domain-containing protein [Candidatus Angelobacter sp.]
MKEFYIVCTECGKQVKVKPPEARFTLVVCDNPQCGASVSYDKNEVREREAAILRHE